MTVEMCSFRCECKAEMGVFLQTLINENNIMHDIKTKNILLSY